MRKISRQPVKRARSSRNRFAFLLEIQDDEKKKSNFWVKPLKIFPDTFYVVCQILGDKKRFQQNTGQIQMGIQPKSFEN